MSLRFFIVAALAALAVAIPVPEGNSLMARQGMSSNDIENGVCRDVTFLFARGSTEQGNMGFVVGPPTCSALKSDLGSDKVACQGIGGAYTAGLAPNFLSAKTDDASINEAKKMFEMVKQKCPKTQIVAGGYSQGSAVIDNSVESIGSDLTSMVKGVVLFGFTRNVQDNGRIPNYPKDQVKVYCAPGDLVCNGTLVITPAHLTYGVDANNAASFLKGTLDN